MKYLTIVAIGIAQLLCPVATLAQNWSQISKAVPNIYDGSNADFFGQSVAIDGNVAVVGASQDNEYGTQAGKAYVLQNSGSSWSVVAELRASDAATNDIFGSSVAIDGDVIVVGAYRDQNSSDQFSGAVYVFQKPGANWSNMTQTAKLTPSVRSFNDAFGISVGISGDVVVVGSAGNNSLEGIAYIYVKPGASWSNMTSQTATLSASDGVSGDRFGEAVAIDGDDVVVGAYGDNSTQGGVYVYTKPGAGWSGNRGQTAKLTASDGAGSSALGRSVSISGTVIAAGSSGDNSSEGAVYIYEKPGASWSNRTQDAKLTASDGASSDLLGISVSISENHVLAGAYFDDDGGNASGSAYVFHKGSGDWANMTQSRKLVAGDDAAADNFGRGVGISGTQLIVGAPGSGTHGAAYFFREINSAPSFTKGANQSVYENTGTHSVSNWATSISDGNHEEQTLTFSVNNNNTGLFTVQPAVNASGTLTFTLASSQTGMATVTLSLSDDGGTQNGGVNQSGSQSFTITVNPTNNAPSFTKGANQNVLEDAAAQTVSNWATSISDGDGGGQTLNFNVSNNNNSLFSSQPAINASGRLTYTPAANTNGVATVTVSLSDDGGTAGGGDDTSDDQTFTITVTSVNDVPSFTKGVDETILEDAGAQTANGWATAIDDGDPEVQTVSFNVSNDNNGLFTTQPSISASGQLTYEPAANTSGSATVTVSIQDNGGTANGGVNQSADQTFTITVTSVNDAPSFTKGADENVLEDAGVQTVNGWATDIDDGDLEVQAVSFNVSNDNNGLFTSQPSIDASGELTYEPAANTSGSATVTVSIQDNGGTANGGVNQSADQTFTITVTSVNDVPSFTKGADENILEDAGAQTVNGWATDIEDGDLEVQAVSFNVSNDNNGLFASQPSIDTNGELTYEPAANSSGSATVTVSIQDNGGTANGGVNQSADQTFTITVTSVNDVPSFTKGADENILEDAGAQTVNGWATDIEDGDLEVQAVSFNVSNDNNGLFASQPSIDTNGELTYEPAANSSGSAMVTVSIQDDGGVTNGGIDESADQTFTITVTSVNDVPSFTKGADEVVLEDAGVQTVNDWATSINDGDPEAQIISFNVSNNNNGLFATQPAIDASGELTYEPAANTSGSAMVSVSIQDNGGTANGGENESTFQTFTITVTSVNDVPSFTKGSDVSLVRNSGSVLISNWATDLDDGDGGFQNLSFNVSNGNNTLFASQPSIDNLGNLSFESAVDAVGSASVTVSISDDGGTSNGGLDTSPDQMFTIEITSVNSAPSFAVGVDVVSYEDEGAVTVSNWASGISDGDGGSQNLTFNVDCDNPSLFDVLPTISADGTLSFTSVGDLYGSTVITVSLTDDGGTVDGGVDTSAEFTFNLTIEPVNDAPGFLAGSDQAIMEDAGEQTLNWASGMTDGDDESQSLTFEVANDNNALFEVPPSIDNAGILSYTPAANAHGLATVSVTLRDDGGTDFGGEDVSVVATFEIEITGVNDAPSFTPGSDVSVLAGTGVHSMADWCTDISDGDEETHGLSFEVTIDDPSLFSIVPSIDAEGTLSFTIAEGVIGSTSVDVVLVDDGGTANGGADRSEGISFDIDVYELNIAPSFQSGSDVVVDEDAGSITMENWATQIDDGNVTEQSLFFTVMVLNRDLFETLPKIESDGTLSFVLAPDAHGETLVNITLMDNGGTESGGVDESEEQSFRVTVNPINDPPSIASLDHLSVDLREDDPHVLFTIEDIDTPLDQLTIDVSSDNADLIDADHWLVSHSGNDYRIDLDHRIYQVGQATLSITVSDGEFMDSTAFLVEEILSVGSNEFEPQLKMYPNPATDRLTVSGSQINPSSIRVFDINGRVMEDIAIQPEGREVRLNISKLKNGLYLLQVGDGQDQKTLRFIKHQL